LDSYKGVRVKSDLAALSFGKKEDVLMYRAAGGVLKIVAPGGIDFVTKVVTSNGLPLAEGSLDKMCHDGKGCGKNGECVRKPAKAADGKDKKKIASASPGKTIFGCECKNGYKGDRCQTPNQKLVAKEQQYWAWSYEGYDAPTAMNRRKFADGAGNRWAVSSDHYSDKGSHTGGHFWDGERTKQDASNYWRAKGHCCPNPPEAVEFYFAVPSIISVIKIEDITMRHAAHFELIKFMVQRWSGDKWITLATHTHKQGTNVKSLQGLETGLKSPALLGHSWRIYLPSDAVPTKDRVHLGELAQLISLQLTPTWTAVPKNEKYQDFAYKGFDAPRTSKSRKFTNGGNMWAVSSDHYSGKGAHTGKAFWDGTLTKQNAANYWRAQGSCCPNPAESVEFHFAKPVVIRSISIEDITTKHASHFELLRYELQRWQASGWRTIAIHDHIDGSNIGGWQYLQNNVRGPDYLSQSWRIFFPPGVHVENKDRVHLGELTSLVTETYTAGSKPAEVNWVGVVRNEKYQSYTYSGYDAPTAMTSRKFAAGTKGNRWAVSSDHYSGKGAHTGKSFWDGTLTKQNAANYWRAKGSCCPNPPEAVEFHMEKLTVITKISIEDITTKHGSHFELLNYELQRWELGRWVTVAKHGHSAGKNVGKHQVLDATGLKGMAEASHNWRIYFPKDAVTNKDRIHLGELVQLQVEINAKG